MKRNQIPLIGMSLHTLRIGKNKPLSMSPGGDAKCSGAGRRLEGSGIRPLEANTADWLLGFYWDIVIFWFQEEKKKTPKHLQGQSGNRAYC
jgi:hypothetical protein